MDFADLCYLSAGQLSRLIKNREVSPVEVIKAHVSPIKSYFKYNLNG
jgi:hypothetical protein